ncbi:MAG: hypothetical protein K9K33_16890, partial [Desulfarculaceae bacterium]|nr:hypothetical protein [Desulfarculaceae bacterium]
MQLALSQPEAARVLAEEGVLTSLPDQDLAAVGAAIAAIVDDGGRPEAGAGISRLEGPGHHRLLRRLGQDGLSPDPGRAAPQGPALA